MRGVSFLERAFLTEEELNNINPQSRLTVAAFTPGKQTCIEDLHWQG